MKTTVTTKKQNYPWVGVDKRDGHVVLFFSDGAGVTLVGTATLHTGEIADYNEDLFTPCTITLSSEA